MSAKPARLLHNLEVGTQSHDARALVSTYLAIPSQSHVGGYESYKYYRDTRSIVQVPQWAREKSHSIGQEYATFTQTTKVSHTRRSCCSPSTALRKMSCRTLGSHFWFAIENRCSLTTCCSLGTFSSSWQSSERYMPSTDPSRGWPRALKTKDIM